MTHAKSIPITGRTIRVSDGAEIAYDVVGEGPPVVCVQGVGVIGYGWRPQVDALAGRFRVITIDNRGIGRSTSGGSSLSIEAMTGDVAAVMAAEGIERGHLIGHSMGGLIALCLAVTHPAGVKSLALLCTFADGADPTRLSMRMMWFGAGTRIGTRRMRRRAMMRMILPGDYVQQADELKLGRELQELFGRDLADQPPIISQQLRVMSKYTAVSRLAEIRVPTLVACGTHDPIAPPRSSRVIANGIAGARFVEYPQASHALPIQCADEVNAQLLSHLDVAEAADRRDRGDLP